MTTRQPLLWMLVLLSALLIGGCTAAPSSQVVVEPPEPTATLTISAPTPTVALPASTPAPAATAIPIPTHTPTTAALPPYVADPAAFIAFSYDGWQTYNNEAYGFDLRYPAGWVAAEVTNPDDTMFRHRVTLMNPADPTTKLHIAFKDASEDRQITPTGIGGGELVARGSVPFLGQPLLRRALVALGKDMGVVYGESGELNRGELVFWVGLNDAGSPLTDSGLSAAVQATADAILASVQTTAGVTAGERVTYRDDVLGFEFDYPSGWTLYDVKPEIKRNSLAYSVTLASWPPREGGGGGVPAGETKMDVTVMRGDPTTLEEAVTERRRQMETQDVPETLLSEANWFMPSGLQAVRWQVESSFGQAAVVLTVINDQTVLASGFGDEAAFDAVARTLRPTP